MSSQIFDIQATIHTLNAVLRRDINNGLALPKIEFHGMHNLSKLLNRENAHTLSERMHITRSRSSLPTEVDGISFRALLDSIAKDFSTIPFGMCGFINETSITLWNTVLWRNPFITTIIRSFVLSKYLTERVASIRQEHFGHLKQKSDSIRLTGACRNCDTYTLIDKHTCFGEISGPIEATVKRIESLLLNIHNVATTPTHISGLYMHLRALYRIDIKLSIKSPLSVSKTLLLSSNDKNHMGVSTSEIYAIAWSLCSTANDLILLYDRARYFGIDALIHRCGSSYQYSKNLTGLSEKSCKFTVYDSVKKEVVRESLRKRFVFEDSNNFQKRFYIYAK